MFLGVKKRVRIITLKTHTKKRKMKDEGLFLNQILLANMANIP